MQHREDNVFVCACWGLSACGRAEAGGVVGRGTGDGCRGGGRKPTGDSRGKQIFFTQYTGLQVLLPF